MTLGKGVNLDLGLGNGSSDTTTKAQVKEPRNLQPLVPINNSLKKLEDNPLYMCITDSFCYILEPNTTL